MNQVQVMIVDDHPVVREGLRALLARSEKLRIVCEAGDGYEALDRLRAVPIDLVLLDWMLPRLDGLETCRRVNAEHPGVKVIMLTNHLDDGSVRQAIHAGASGYLLKDVSFDELESAILDVFGGRTTLHPEAQHSLSMSVSKDANNPLTALTDREMDVLRLIATGNSNKEIAKTLGLTEGTVKGYVSTILGKTGTADRTQAALMAVRIGLK